MKTATSMLFVFCIVGVTGCVSETPESTAPTGVEAQIQDLLAQFPEATQIDDHSIGWEDGKVVLVLPDDDATGERSLDDHGVAAAPVVSLKPDRVRVDLANAHSCPSGWYCVYAAATWGGRRLQFSDCTRNDLANYGFRDQTSSWVNNGSHTVQVMNDVSFLPDTVLWTMSAQSSSAWVGSANNDKADYFRCQ